MIRKRYEVELESQTETDAQRYQRLLEEFREIYRQTWGHPTMQKIFRHGAHWMMPDDHDIFDNLDRHHLNSTLSPVVRAGRQAYYEYQFQLQEDGDLLDSEGRTSPRILSDAIDHYIRIGSTILVFMDTRFQRVFQYESERPLFGQRQMLQLQENLAGWGKDDKIKTILILTAVPVLFQSTPMCVLAEEMTREKYGAHPDLLSDTLYFLNLVKPFHKKIWLISGDIHQFAHVKICESSGEVCLTELISSGMTRSSASAFSWTLVVYFMIGKLPTTVVEDWTAFVWHNFLGNSYTVLKLTHNDFLWQAVLRQASNESFEFRLALFLFDNALVVFVLVLVVILLCCGLAMRRLSRVFCSPKVKDV